MRADFYRLGEETPERTIPLLAAKVKQAGKRLLVVSRDPAQLKAIGEALWAERADDFLAHGIAGGPHDARQPILLSDSCEAANGARMVMFADGEWRDEGIGFERAFLLFGEDRLEGARAAWRGLDGGDGLERRYWKREGGKWVEGP